MNIIFDIYQPYKDLIEQFIHNQDLIAQPDSSNVYEFEHWSKYITLISMLFTNPIKSSLYQFIICKNWDKLRWFKYCYK